MKLHVQYMAQLRAAVGRAEEIVDFPEGSSLSELLVHLAERRCEAAPHLINNAGQARSSLLLVVNDAAVAASEAATTILHSGDVVILLPPIAGG